jgi:hypothetical protein
MNESNEVFAAKVELAFYNFFRAHWREGLSSCQANRAILEDYMDENLLDASKAESFEIAYLACGNQLARKAKPAAPTPPAPVVIEPAALTEDERLREILREHKGDPKAASNAARAILKTKDAQNKAQQTTLPADITGELLRKMPADRMRKLQTRYGATALTARLQGKG